MFLVCDSPKPRIQVKLEYFRWHYYSLIDLYLGVIKFSGNLIDLSSGIRNPERSLLDASWGLQQLNDPIITITHWQKSSFSLQQVKSIKWWCFIHKINWIKSLIWPIVIRLWLSQDIAVRDSMRYTPLTGKAWEIRDGGSIGVFHHNE